MSSNKLPAIVKKDTILKKIFNFVKRKFKKKTKNKKKTTPNMKYDKNRINELYKIATNNDKIIKEVKQQEKMIEIIKLIEKNPETLENLDTQRLEVIDSYYKSEIERYKKKISKVS